ncbi:MAG: L-fucose isomerase [Phycisphaerae bacterium]|nr:L-fucose isomerase [Phycisphaerae bacterium]
MKIGIITFTDGRARVAKATDRDCHMFQDRLASWFKGRKHQVVVGRKIVWNWETARTEARRIALTYPDVLVLNYCVWSFPALTAQVANLIPDVPIILVGNMLPSHPGWVAFFASAGTLDEVGRPFVRVLGDIQQRDVQKQVESFLHRYDPDQRGRGERAAAMLHGLRYGSFDGPSMGMYTGHVDPSQWMEQFGIHVYHRGQLHLWELARKIDESRVGAGLKWLEKYCGAIHYDGKKLTPGLNGTLARQVRMYLAMKDFCKHEGIDYCGLTGQLDMTEHADMCIADVQEALLNDTADWEEPAKKPLICGTECDSNGALTMQLMHHLSDTPVLFADLRHYFAREGVYDLCNSGQHAPWFAKRSSDFRKNWKQVQLQPALDFYFRSGGASVQFYAAPADKVTFARITRRRGHFLMHMFTGSFARLPRAREEALARQTTYTWPHVFARFDAPLSAIRDHYSSNHIHAIIGDHVGALVAACELLGIEPVVLSA